MSSYRKSMSEVYNNMYLSEDNVAVLRNIVKNKQMQPIKFSDGKMGVDLFTASAVTQALDKVNDKNREKLTKLINTGKKSAFASIAKVVMKSENYPEIEEAVSMAQQAAIAISKKERGNKPKKEEADDFKTHMMYDPKTGKGYKADTMDDHLRMKKMGYTHDAPKKEEVDLDEGFKTGDKVKIDTEFEGETHNGQSGVIHKVGTGRNKGAYTVKFSDGKVQSYDDEELIKEEVDLDEASKEGTIKIIKTKDGKFQIQKMTKGKFVDIGKPYNSAKEAEKFRSGQSNLFGEEVDLDEASARADAMRAMRKGKTVDPADIDTDASDDDVKSASKNIIMQLRKSVSLRGNFPVEFTDKKKVKVSAKIAQAVQNKHNSMKKANDKEKFQAKVSKSYKDMLSALKENTILDKVSKKLKEIKNG